MADPIQIPTTKPIELASGVEYTFVILKQANYLFRFKLDRGTAKVSLTNKNKPVIEGTEVFGRNLPAIALKTDDQLKLTVTAAVSGAKITLEAVEAPQEQYGMLVAATGVKHAVSIIEHTEAVIYFGLDVANAQQSLFVRDGDIIIPSADLGFAPNNLGISLTPIIHQTKAATKAVTSSTK